MKRLCATANFLIVLSLAATACSTSNDPSPEQSDAGPEADAETEVDTDGGEDLAEENWAPGHEQTFIPHASWSCGMPDGIPSVVGGERVLQANVTIGDIHDLGLTQYGQRQIVEMRGGTVTGPAIKGTLWTGSLDLQLTLANDAREIEQLALIMTDDGASILVRNCGVAASADGEVRLVLDFEAPTAGKYAFLNEGTYVGVRSFDASARTLTWSAYRVKPVATTDDVVHIEEPAGALEQSWTCIPGSGERGDVVYVSEVSVDGMIMLGIGKRGQRTIIPITGGSATGRLTATVLRAGADFVLIENGYSLDARYLLRGSDGEIIFVRNCGTLAGLNPTFETRANGANAWLNENKWLSDFPVPGDGIVTITVRERKP